MDVLIILVFISLVLVVGALLLLLVRIRGGDFEHLDRLPFLPLEPDRRPRADGAGPLPGSCPPESQPPGPHPPESHPPQSHPPPSRPPERRSQSS